MVIWTLYDNILYQVGWTWVTKHARITTLPRFPRGHRTENPQRYLRERSFWDVRECIHSREGKARLCGRCVHSRLEPAVRKAIFATGRQEPGELLWPDSAWSREHGSRLTRVSELLSDRRGSLPVGTPCPRSWRASEAYMWQEGESLCMQVRHQRVPISVYQLKLSKVNYTYVVELSVTT